MKDQKDDHVKRVVEFSIDAIQAASEVLVDEDDPSKGNIQIRVGLHSGKLCLISNDRWRFIQMHFYITVSLVFVLVQAQLLQMFLELVCPNTGMSVDHIQHLFILHTCLPLPSLFVHIQ